MCVMCAYLHPHIFLGGISFQAVMPLLHHSTQECWMEQLLSFLFFTIMIVSCSPICFCQVFLHAINLPHLCTSSVSYSFFSYCTELCMVFYSVGSYSGCICKPLEYAFLNPLYVFRIQLSVELKIFVIWAARKSFFLGLSLFTFCNVQTVGCHGTCSKSMLSLRVL